MTNLTSALVEVACFQHEKTWPVGLQPGSTALDWRWNITSSYAPLV